MRSYFRDWYCRLTSRRGARAVPSLVERPARPRLIYLEDKSLPSGTAQGTVFRDLNANGAFDPGLGDTGVGNVTVTAYDSANTNQGSTTTGPGGDYLLNLSGTGPYRLEFTAIPPGLGYGVQGADAAGPVQFVAEGGGVNLGLALNELVGVTPSVPIEIGDRLWLDIDNDGIQDAAPGSGLGNVVVQLLDVNSNTVLGVATTDPAGRFLFNSGSGATTSNRVFGVPLAPNGLYQLRVDVGQAALAGLTLSPFQVASGPDSNLRDSDGQLDQSGTFAFANFSVGGFGQGNPNLDFGFTNSAAGTAAVGDTVWNDLNGNGIQDPNEPGLAGAAVRLLDLNSNVVQQTVTGPTGNYLFSGVAPGSYRLDVTLPGGYSLSPAFQGGDPLRDSDFDPNTGATVAFVLTANGAALDLDAGATPAGIPTAAIGDFAWFDANLNGIFDNNEIGLINVVVNLYDGSGVTLLGSTKTDAFGFYLFPNLNAGDYVVEFKPPPAFVLTIQNAGGNDDIDSDPDPVTGRTSVITLADGQLELTIDAGFIKPVTGAIGDFVWIDLNCDGIFQPTENGLAGVTVNLLDGQGTFIKSTVTDPNGRYFFSGLNPADYIVEFVLPVGYVFSPPNQGGDDQIDSDADPLTGRTPIITVTAGSVNNTVDAGLCPTANLGDFVWIDLNCDGIFQAGEQGLAGVFVNLLDGNGNFIAQTQTDAAGKYAFTNLPPASYIVEFTLPAGYVFSPPNQGGDDQIDSDADPLTGRTPVVTLAPGETNNSIDAGLCPTANLGDFVWIDLNCDGIFQPGEPGFAGITVNLFDGLGNFVGTTTTDGTGNYAFTNLAPGDYQVEFIAPPGYVFSPPNQGGDDQIDSDVDPATGFTPILTLAPGETNNSVDAGLCPPPTSGARVGDFVFLDLNCDGIQQPTDPGVAGVSVFLLDAQGTILATTFTDADGKYLFDNLAPGDYQVRFTPPVGFAFTKANAGAPGEDSDADPSTGLTPVFTLAADGTDLTRDAGLVTLKDISGFVYVDANDNGVFEPGEQPIAGVTITLAGTDDLGQSVLVTAPTGADGQYVFVNVRPGTYSLTETQPQGFLDGKDTPGTPFGGVVVANDVISDINIDCDPNAPSGVDYNFGELIPSSLCGKVYWDLNNDGIPEPGEPGIAGVTVTLSGTDNRGNAVLRKMVTGPDGTYLFTGLRGGTYAVAASQSPFFIDGQDRVGNAGGVLGNDEITNIPLPIGFDACFYDFGEILPPGGGNKEELLASFQGERSPNLLDYAALMPTAPTFANAISVTQLCSPLPTRFVVTSADAGQPPRVRVFNYGIGTVAFDFNAYDPAFRGGVRVAVGDVTGDGVPDVITAPGAGGGPHIRVFDGSTGSVVAEFYAYAPGFTGGVYVAAADVDGDGVAEIITGAGEGGGPHVKIFTAAGAVVNEYFAYAAAFFGGVRVAGGDVNGDGIADVMTAAGPGGGPHVRVFAGASQTELYGFFAYDPNFTGGVFVAAGDVTGDGAADIITGAGAGGGPHVRVFNGPTGVEVFGYFAYGTFPSGVRVGATDINGDGKADVLTTPGVGLPTYTTVFDIQRAANLDAFLSFDPSVLTGAFVAGG